LLNRKAIIYGDDDTGKVHRRCAFYRSQLAMLGAPDFRQPSGTKQPEISTLRLDAGVALSAALLRSASFVTGGPLPTRNSVGAVPSKVEPGSREENASKSGMLGSHSMRTERAL